MSSSSTRSSGMEDSLLEPIAICGMGCRLPGGIDSDASFWDMLVNKRTGQTPRVPESRFNIDAHYHPKLDRPGSINVMGGYFLDGKPHDFDPSFFNVTPVEAQWLDPQQRKILEVSYECLVSAGLTLDAVAGSNTAVFVGCFTADYQQMSTRDPDFRHNYVATGVDPGIISNRIGHTFNLRGPSFTINTACSSSVYAIHNACHALRSRDCEGAIVGGVNLILTVDQHMNTAKLGILSPTSTCHTFDESADGYGRAEAAGALYLKRLSDAVRDGNPIRGVIRSTAVNTNGKVDGMGITHPSVEGQERVLRMAYKKGGLDPNLTDYAELHGTGTPVGDPIEVKAVSSAMNDSRPRDRPLIIGAVKPNIGHSEAASGIFAVMKAALMTEAAVIPGVALLKNLNPAILEQDWNVKVQRNTTPWPGDSLVRRSSVSSFGYGGTNGHVIVEAVESLYPWYQHAKPKKSAAYDHSTSKPVLVTFSAHDKKTLLRNIAAIQKLGPNYYLADLAHTLNLHRTQFANRAFVVARENDISNAFVVESLKIGAVPKKKLNEIGFLFTGQGAQWVGMAREALQHFPSFKVTIQRLDSVLKMIHPPPKFEMTQLLEDSETAAHSTISINDASVSQPLCTAIQIALVDLLSSWGINPSVSVGHSSGEIAAAYSAGLISAPEAIIAAFCRGRAVEAKSTTGSMLAVGLGLDEVAKFLPEDPAELCVACENSPSSVTLSGRSEVIARTQKLMESEGIFARELKTGRAYHSPHMGPVGDFYDAILVGAHDSLDVHELSWRRQTSHFVSSVTGELISGKLPEGYFSANLRNMVRFNTAIQVIGNDTDKNFSQIGQMIDIGPHSALSGPFKQICTTHKFDRFTYIPTMVRKSSDVDQILSTAGSLFNYGYPVDLATVNSHIYDSDIQVSRQQPKTSYLLVDLPPYQWNYEKDYWVEPRPSVEQRNRVFPRHDLLGSRISGLTARTRAWRNILRHRDIPWLKHHNIGGTAIFPAAGHLAIATEALRQVYDEEGLGFQGVLLRDVAIDKALTLPETDDGVEIVISLTATNDQWHSFSVESLTDGEWNLHCKGRVSAAEKTTAVSTQSAVDRMSLNQRATGKTWYEALRRVGFNYGSSFQQLKTVRTDGKTYQASGDVAVLTSSSTVEDESRYVIHPSTVDACFQLIIISIHAGRHKEMPWGVVPTSIEEISIFPPAAGDDEGSIADAVAWTDGFHGRQFNTNTVLTSRSGSPLVHVTNLTCTAYEAAIPAASVLAKSSLPQPFSEVVWKPDIANLTTEQFERAWPQLTTRLEREVKFFELISHRQPLHDVLLICGPSPLLDKLESMLEALPSQCSITVALCGPVKQDKLSKRVRASMTVCELDSVAELWEKPDMVSDQDLILMDLDPAKLPATMLSLLRPNGWLLGSSVQGQSFFSMRNHDGFLDDVTSVLCVGQQFAIHKVSQHDDSRRNDVDGKNGVPLAHGANGTKHINDINGTNGVNGVGGAESPNGTTHGTNRVNGTHGVKHTNGAHHINGIGHANGTNGVNGRHHTNSTNGINSKKNTTNGSTAKEANGPKMVTVLSRTSSKMNRHQQHILSALKLPESKVAFKSLAGFDDHEDKRIVIDDIDGGVLSSIDAPTFNALKSLIASGLPTVWLTRGVNEGKCPSGGLAVGFLRVVRSEHGNSRVTLLDCDHDDDECTVWETVLGQLEAVSDDKEAIRDTEFWLHQGVLHISRVYPSDDLNQSTATTSGESLEHVSLPYGKSLQPNVVDGHLVFRQQDVQGQTLASGQVDVQVLASEFVTARGELGIAVGLVHNAHVETASLVGKRVIAIVRNQFQTMMRTSEFVVIGQDKEHVSSESIIALLAPCTRIAFVHAHIQRGQQVMMLPSSREEAYITAMVAKSEDWKLSVATNSDDLRKEYTLSPFFAGVPILFGHNDQSLLERIKESTDTPTAVIGHDFSSLSQGVWRHLGAHSAFYLLAGDKLEMAPDAAPFARGVSFVPLSRHYQSVESSKLALDLTRDMGAEHFNLMKTLAATIDIADLSVAEWTAQNQRSRPPPIIRCDYTSSQVKVLPETTRLQLSEDGVYLLVGCLGGLGRSLTKFMMEHGAKRFAFVSRSGMENAEAARTVQLLRKAGASANVFRADVSDEEAMQDIVSRLVAEHAIRGVVHAAMVLKDGMLDRMDSDAFNTVVAPKAKGALAVHNAVKDLKGLDFFIMTSSISALLGNMGQGNYSAANGFLDAMAQYRNHQGLVATSLVLPMVLDVGVVAENDSIETSLMRKGLYGIDEREMLRGFEVAMGQRPAHVIMGMDANELAQSISKAGGIGQADVYWYEDPRLSHVRTSIERKGAKTETGGGGNADNHVAFAVALKSAVPQGEAAVLDVIARHIAQRVSSILMIPVDDFELEGRSVASYGLDSMIGAEMRTWLFKEFALDFPFQKLLAPTLSFVHLAAEAARSMGIIAASG